MKDTLSRLVMSTLHHFKSVEHRMEWSKVTHQFGGKDKHIVNSAINKVRSAITDLVTLSSPQSRIAINQTLRCDERLVQYMSLVEQLYELPLDDLEEVTCIIDYYLEQKHGSNTFSQQPGVQQTTK